MSCKKSNAKKVIINNEKILAIRCPVCHSVNTIVPAGWNTFLYSVKPIECDDCETLFESSIITRVFLWALVTSVFTMATFASIFEEFFGKEIVQWITILIVGSIFVVPIIGGLMEYFKPWQYTPWKGSELKRKIINYGSELSFVIYGIYFLAQKA